MGTMGVAILEEWKPLKHRGGGYVVETWEHSSLAQDAEVVERRLYSGEHVANCHLGSVHRGHL